MAGHLASMKQEITQNQKCAGGYLITLRQAVKALRRDNGRHVKVKCLQNNTRKRAVDTKTKACTYCKIEKPLTEFFSRGGKLLHLYKSRCKLCMQAKRQEWAENNKDHLNEWRKKNWVESNRRLKRRGITQKIYDELYEAQRGCCAICNEPEEKFSWLCIDHDHESGRIRGLLCPNCNRGIGLLKDNADLLERAAKYIKTAKKEFFCKQEA